MKSLATRFVWMLLGIIGCLIVTRPSMAQNEAIARVVFYAMGDVPYAPGEDELLPRQIEEIPKDAAFVVHVGDIKTGSMPCDEVVYNKVFAMLAQAESPVFIIPGDNEWNDCGDPAQAWQYWKKYFMRFDRRWSHRLPVFRQLDLNQAKVC